MSATGGASAVSCRQVDCRKRQGEALRWDRACDTGPHGLVCVAVSRMAKGEAAPCGRASVGRRRDVATTQSRDRAPSARSRPWEALQAHLTDHQPLAACASRAATVRPRGGEGVVLWRIVMGIARDPRPQPPGECPNPAHGPRILLDTVRPSIGVAPAASDPRSIGCRSRNAARTPFRRTMKYPGRMTQHGPAAQRDDGTGTERDEHHPGS
jgi:hypothetical protein